MVNHKVMLVQKKLMQQYSKRIVLLYLKHLSLLIKRAGWLVEKIYSHFTFKQGRFKKDFVLMNQRSRQEARTLVEQYIFKLLIIRILVMIVAIIQTLVLLNLN